MHFYDLAYNHHYYEGQTGKAEIRRNKITFFYLFQ